MESHCIQGSRPDLVPGPAVVEVEEGGQRQEYVHEVGVLFLSVSLAQMKYLTYC